jgi:hypothetical protein
MESLPSDLKTYSNAPHVEVKTPKIIVMYVSLKTSALSGHEQGALWDYLPYSKDGDKENDVKSANFANIKACLTFDLS